ncbi:MAG: porin [Bacteroidaceae bacterium]|nr:porin [Bacteroidaceae bacterium]
MKRTILTGLFALCVAALPAQIHLSNLRLEARADYQREYADGSEVEDNCGFKGKFLNIRMDGKLGNGFSYSYRQRLNKPNKDASFFDATDWINLTYSTGAWSFGGGKQVVAIGGYEYDAAPIDLYFCSEYWHHIPCYQVGVSAAYTIGGGSDKFMVQVCQSPWRANAGDMYAYNLMWCASYSNFSTLCSVNMMEVYPGKYINYIALGTELQVGECKLRLDLMNRASDEHAFWGKDISMVGEAEWLPNEHLTLFAKATYDVNNTDGSLDLCVLPGTEITRVGAGVEYYPMKNGSKDVRLHANACYTFGENGNLAGALIDKQTLVDVGLTWRIDLLGLGFSK